MQWWENPKYETEHKALRDVMDLAWPYSFCFIWDLEGLAREWVYNTDGRGEYMGYPITLEGRAWAANVILTMGRSEIT